jgi:hypothetical protein
VGGGGSEREQYQRMQHARMAELEATAAAQHKTALQQLREVKEEATREAARRKQAEAAYHVMRDGWTAAISELQTRAAASEAKASALQQQVQCACRSPFSLGGAFLKVFGLRGDTCVDAAAGWQVRCERRVDRVWDGRAGDALARGGRGDGQHGATAGPRHPRAANHRGAPLVCVLFSPSARASQQMCDRSLSCRWLSFAGIPMEWWLMVWEAVWGEYGAAPGGHPSGAGGGQARGRAGDAWAAGDGGVEGVPQPQCDRHRTAAAGAQDEHRYHSDELIPTECGAKRGSPVFVRW